MKKRTRIASLVAAAAMTVSALPMAALPALAVEAGDHGCINGLQYHIVTAEDRASEVKVSLDDVTSSDYTFKAGLYLSVDDQTMTADDYVSTVSMMWEASDEKYMYFRQDDYGTSIAETQYTLPDGTAFSATLKPFALAQLTYNPKKGYRYTSKTSDFYDKSIALEPAYGKEVYSAGPNKVKFTLTYYTEGQLLTKDDGTKYRAPVPESQVTKDYELDVTVDENGTGSYTYEVPDAGTVDSGAYPMRTVTGTLHNYDPTVPSGEKIPGDNNLLRVVYSTDGTSFPTWLGDQADAYPMATFDVTLKQGTPEGVYYVKYNTTEHQDVLDKDGNVVGASYMNRVVRAYKESGSRKTDVQYPDGLEDESNWLKIIVGSPSNTTTTTTDQSTTTTTSATTTETNQTTTTTTTTTAGGTTTTTDTPSYNGPTIKVGQQFVNAGEEWATAVKPEIYNGGDFVTEGLSLAFKVGDAADPATAALMEAWTYEDLDSSSAFNDLGSWKVNKDEMIWASLTNGTSKIDVGTLTDGMSPLELYYTIPDEDTINKIAADHNMVAKKTEDGAYYYEFPLQFAPDKINSEGGSALLWAGENNTVIDANYVDGSVCVIVTNPNPVTTTTTATSGPITTTTTTTTTTNSNPLVPFYGDVNVNGQVTIIDVVLLNKAVAGKVTLSEQATLNADCVHDNVIDELDAKALLAYLVGWDGFETLPVTADAVSTLPL
ncbi:MAG: dockerin type I repeat-containing protein [Oscillospiraceae bacterium]|nr:dockerin type I repeat-containing protein [Oscillospiraceae bacterium]